MNDRIKHSDDRAAVVDHDYFWRPIDDDTPRGAKLQLVHELYGVAVYGQIGSNDKFFTHWAPLPKFRR